MTVREQAEKAKEASYRLIYLSCKVRDGVLRKIAKNIDESRPSILMENQADLEQAESDRVKLPLIKRLKLDHKKIDQMIAGIYKVSKLPDPVGRRIVTRELDRDLILYKVSAPIGLIGVIFESRPDALVQIASLCLKSANAVILKGGSEADRTNTALHNLIIDALNLDAAFKDSVQLVRTREEIRELLKLDQFVDLVVPRGSNELVSYIKQNTKIPVLGHSEGICHLFIDREADCEMALKLARDSKCQYPAVCNAIETLLVHEELAESFLPRLRAVLEDVELRGDEKTSSIIDVVAASEEDWGTEYNDLILSIRVVADTEEAIRHINRFGSHHTDAIVTGNRRTAENFMNCVDSASVMWNSSTRFADGFRYGLGAEIGISTGKIHARGPVGLEGLTIYKYRLIGDGAIVAPYVEGKRKFTHRKL